MLEMSYFVKIIHFPVKPASDMLWQAAFLSAASLPVVCVTSEGKVAITENW